jgi:hypothetical protein
LLENKIPIDTFSPTKKPINIHLNSNICAFCSFRYYWLLFSIFSDKLWRVFFIPNVNFGWVMVSNATFNNIPAISLLSVFIGRGNRSTRGNPPTCRKSLTNFITFCCIEYTSPWSWFELKNLVGIGADYTGSCKSNYHTITTTTTSNIKSNHRIHVKTFPMQI